MSARQWIFAAALLLTFAVGYFAVKWFMQTPTKPSVDEGRASADSFLTLVREGKAGEAWDAATTEFKSIEGRESFMRKAKSTAILSEPLKFGSVQNAMVHNSPRSEFLYTSPENGGTVRVLIGYEQGTWKVDRLTY